MTIKAVYTFIDEGSQYHVYKYCDGTPRMAAHFINCATSLSWRLPKYEAGEFASAFIAANKISCGDIGLTRDYKSHSDLDYRYEVYPMDRSLYIKLYEREGDQDYAEGVSYRLLYRGSLTGFIKKCAYTHYV